MSEQSKTVYTVERPNDNPVRRLVVETIDVGEMRTLIKLIFPFRKDRSLERMLVFGPENEQWLSSLLTYIGSLNEPISLENIEKIFDNTFML